MTGIKLGGEDNAITSATIFLESSQPFSSDRLGALSARHGEFQDSLPRRMLKKAVKIELGEALPNQVSPTAHGNEEISGVTFDYLQPSGNPKWALIAEGNRLTFFCGEYTKWKDFKERANSLIRRAYTVLFQHNVVVGIGLQYRDQFYWTGSNRSDMNADKIYKCGTAYLPSSIFEYEDLWHNNQGFFKTVTTPIKGQVLTNINASIIDKEEHRWSDLITLHSCRNLYIKNESELFMGDGKKPNFELVLNYLHDENKEVLRSLFNEEILDRIGLSGE